MSFRNYTRRSNGLFFTNGSACFRSAVPHRTLVYMRDGTLKARGLKKNESDYLTVNGVTYPGNDKTLEPAKAFLGEEFYLPDATLLQTLTHKSFAHGKKPYNEKLAILGKEYLKMHTSDYAVSQDKESPLSINNKNFDIVPQAMEILSSSSVTSEVCKISGIANNIFWKKRDEVSNSNFHRESVDEALTVFQKLSEKEAGAPTVYSKTIFALVGAVLLQHGQKKADSFVSQKLLSGPYSVLPISQKLYRS